MGFLGRHKSGVSRTKLKFPNLRLVSQTSESERAENLIRKQRIGEKIEKNSRLRRMESTGRYIFMDTNILHLLVIRPEMGEVLVNELARIAKKASAGKERVRILDWGCGTGNMLKSINDYFAKTALSDGARKISKYGFTIDGYPEIEETLEADRSLKIAHTDIESFERWLKAVRRKGLKFDLIFSHYGLRYLHEERKSHYIELLKTLKDDGVLIAFPLLGYRFSVSGAQKLKEEIESKGYLIKNVTIGGPNSIYYSFTIIKKVKTN
jgi:SAM-dependent methyltransferase